MANDILKDLEEYFKNTPQEEIQKAIDRVNAMPSCGPTVEEYFDSLNYEHFKTFKMYNYNKEEFIKFGKFVKDNHWVGTSIEALYDEWAEKQNNPSPQELEEWFESRFRYHAFNYRIDVLQAWGCVVSNISDFVFYKINEEYVSVATQSELKQMSDEDWVKKLTEIKNKILDK